MLDKLILACVATIANNYNVRVTQDKAGVYWSELRTGVSTSKGPASRTISKGGESFSVLVDDYVFRVWGLLDDPTTLQFTFDHSEPLPCTPPDGGVKY